MKHIDRLLVVLSVAMLAACAQASIPTPTPTPPSTATPTATLTPAPTLTPTPTSITYPMRLEKVGQLGGIADALAMSGDIVYLQAGPRLVTVDVSDPYKPTQIGRSDVLPGGIKTIGALDHYALVGDGEGTLWVFDVPASGDPQVVSNIEIGGLVLDMMVSGQYAYLAAGEAGLQIVDLSVPSRPEIAGALELTNVTVALAKTENLIAIDRRPPLDIASSYVEATDFIDVSNVKEPKLLSAEEAQPVRDSVTRIGYLEVNNLKFRVSFPGSWHTVIGVATDVKDPPPYDALFEPLPPGTVVNGHRLASREHWLYVAFQYGLAIYDISVAPEYIDGDPDLQWKQVGWFQTDFGTMSMGCCDQWYHGEILNLGDYLYTFTRNKAFVWSLTDPANPTLIRSLDRPFAEWSSITIPVNGGIILEDYLRDGAYSILDTRNPSAAIITKVLLSKAEGYIMAVDRGRLLYCSGPDVQIFDIADPYHPHLLGRHRLSFGLVNPFHLRFLVIGELVFITGKEASSGGIVLDISDPSNPFEANVPWPAFLAPVEVLINDTPYLQNLEVLIHGDAIFTLRENNLQVYTTDNLSTPLAILDLPIAPGVNNHLSYSDGRLVVRTSTGEEGGVTSRVSVTLVDVENPAQPQLLASWEQAHHPAPGWIVTLQVAAYGDYLYVHMNEDGVYIFKLVPN